jgi:uncharacterized protein DUF1566
VVFNSISRRVFKMNSPGIMAGLAILSVLLCAALIQAADRDRFVVSEPVTDEEIVTDNLTGLVWQETFVAGKTWYQALEYCETLDYADFEDWRLPNLRELQSLINHGRYSPATDFPSTLNLSLWSSTTYANDIYKAWGVSFSAGGNGQNLKIESVMRTRCVRLGP